MLYLNLKNNFLLMNMFINTLYFDKPTFMNKVFFAIKRTVNIMNIYQTLFDFESFNILVCVIINTEYSIRYMNCNQRKCLDNGFV